MALRRRNAGISRSSSTSDSSGASSRSSASVAAWTSTSFGKAATTFSPRGRSILIPRGAASTSGFGRSAGWGTYDYNVSDDSSASGSHSVKNWKPSWNNTTDYTPVGLSLSAGYRP